MKTGMLWFDNDVKTDLAGKIKQAAIYYQKKYGCLPNVCFVHPSMLKENAPKSQGIEVQSSQMILPNHLWLGIHDNSAVSHP